MDKILITAVTLSRAWCSPRPVGVAHLSQTQEVRDCAGYNEAFYGAIAKVQTPYFFFLDDDDTLPSDYLSVLTECIQANTAVAYTDELRQSSGGVSTFKSGTYSAQAHIDNPTLLHHLVVCRTDAAQDALRLMPRGQFWPELPLYFHLAKESVAYIPRTGYHWNRSGYGLSAKADFSIGQLRSRLWCRERLI